MPYKNTSYPRYFQGFTLVELVVVILLLGVLSVVAVPKFLNIQEDAQAAAVKGTAAAFKSAIDMAHMFWALKHANDQKDEFHVYGDGDEGTVDFNKNGWPAQHYNGIESTVELANDDDCESVWRIMFQNGAPYEKDNPYYKIHTNFGEPSVIPTNKSVSDLLYSGYKMTKEEAEYIVKYADYKSQYLGNNSCRYFYNKNKKFSIYYNSNIGEVKFEKNVPYPQTANINNNK